MRIKVHKRAIHKVTLDIWISHKAMGKTAMASKLKNLGLIAEYDQGIFVIG
jgi:hypothetical protein